MRRLLFCVLLTSLATLGWAEGDRDKTIERVDAAGTVLNEIMAAPDKGIPEEILNSARCVAVVPSYLKGAFVVGANARDLRQPKKIDVSRARELHSFVRDGQIFVAESGIASVDDARLLPARVDAVLIGSALMRADDPEPLIRGIASIRRRGHDAAQPEEKVR